MVGQPLVSVVTIFKDAERFLDEAVDSVFAQSHPGWELLLIDDGSVDGSTEIARRRARREPDRVRYFEHEGHSNRGMSASRNLGISRACGEYVALLDSDDVWLPRRLEESVAVFAAHPEAAMVYGNRQYWTSWEGGSTHPSRDSISEHGITADRLLHPPELFLLTFGENQATNPGSDVIFRRETGVRLGGFDEAFHAMYEDQVFLAKVYLAEPVFVSSRCWTKYRQHADSCVARWAGEEEGQAESRLHFLRWIEGYLAHQEIRDRRVWAALQKAMRPYRHPWLHRAIRLSKRGAQQALSVAMRMVGVEPRIGEKAT
jgi:glycosyltransferase involved in cell wall biosynthesis